MANRYAFFIFTIFIFIKSICATAHVNYTTMPEQLFLDLPLQHVFDNSSLPVVEPWASKYVNAILERRYGDAIWARYHIAGQVLKNGTVDGSNLTVLQSIKEDAVEYKVNAPEQFQEALSFYANSSSKDGNAHVLNMISNISLKDISSFQERTTYTTTCSGGWLAFQEDCLYLLDHMWQGKLEIGTRVRALSSHGDCHLRVGPHGRGGELTYYAAHAVGKLIEEDCTFLQPCCGIHVTSGYSPENRGHRKVCLSKKDTGCS